MSNFNLLLLIRPQMIKFTSRETHSTRATKPKVETTLSPSPSHHFTNSVSYYHGNNVNRSIHQVYKKPTRAMTSKHRKHTHCIEEETGIPASPRERRGLSGDNPANEPNCNWGLRRRA